MAAEHIGYEEFEGPLGGLPDYAARDTSSSPLAETAAYGENPNASRGVSGVDDGLVFEDPEAEAAPGAEADTAGIQQRTGIEDQYFDDAGARSGREDAATIPDADVRPDGVAGTQDNKLMNGPVEDDVRIETIVIRYPFGHEVDHEATTEAGPEVVTSAESADAAQGPEVQPGANDSDERTADADEDVDAFIAETLGIDIEQARQLVEKAVDSQNDEHADAPDVSSSAPDDESHSGATDGDEHGADTGDTSGQHEGGVMGFLRSAAAGVSGVARNEAKIFAEGARAFGESARELVDGREERRNAKAVDSARKDLDKEQGRWEKFGEKRGGGIQAPRGRRHR